MAIRPSTGEILAAANGPGNGGQNLATFGQSAPGSTFKTVSSLALLRAGLTPDTVVPCTPTVTVDGKEFKNYSDYPSSALGNIPLRTAVANSCNTAFISQAPKLSGHRPVRRRASPWAWASTTTSASRRTSASADPDTESETGAAAQLIGQGTILASPMVMATVIASVQQGSLVVPRLVEGVDVSAPEGAAPLTEAEATALRSMLRGVVTDGSGRGLLDVPGRAGDREDRHRRVRHRRRPADPRLDDRRPGRPGGLRLRRGRRVRVSGTAGPILEAFLRAAGSPAETYRGPARSQASGSVARPIGGMAPRARADPPLHGVNEGPLPISQCSLRSRRSTDKRQPPPRLSCLPAPVAKWPT